MKGREPWRGPLARLRACLAPAGRRRFGEFTLEGIRLVERALRSGVPLSLVVAAERVARADDPRVHELLQALRARRGLALHFAPDEEVERFTEGRALGPFLALAKVPEPPVLAECLRARTGDDARVLLLVAEGVQDPGNVGALSRTALALGARALVAVGVADPYHPKAVRTSMGSLFRLPILVYADAAPLLDELRALGVATVGAVSGGGVTPAELAGRTGALALLLGSEAFGLPEELSERLDHLVTIPMASGVDSLSVNAAAAVLLYELSCRRPR